MINENLQKELREQFNPDGSLLRSMQLRMLEMLKYFDSVCKQHNIQYWISSGTVLGAVRHGGFIPWDDDLDVEMLKEDYQKLCKVFAKIKSENYAFQNNTTDPEYYFPTAKLRDLNSFIEEEYYNYGLYCKYRGIFMDIFILEPSSSKILLKLTGGIQNKILYKLAVIKNKKLRRCVVKPLHYFLSCGLYPTISFISRIFSNGKVYRHCPGVNFIGPRYKEDLFPLKNIKFEGFEFPAPNNVDNYLKTLYGDYMKLPNVEKLHSHIVKVSIS